MTSLLRLLVVSMFAALLLGCAAMMVPMSSDPERKLGWAIVLLEEQDRPLPAEKLIREAIEIYQTRNDEIGLAEGYRKYGIFFRSYSVTKWEHYYRKNGFLDTATSFDQRFDRAIEYFTKSREIYINAKTYDDRVSNVEFNLALAYMGKGELNQACKALDSSIAFNTKFRSTDPDAKIKGAGNNQSFEDVIAEQKKRAKCS